MSLRLIEIYVDEGHTDTLTAIAEQQEAVDCYTGAIAEDGRRAIRMLVSPSSQQAILDQIQTALSGSEGWRVVLLPVEAALPEPPAGETSLGLPSSKTASREELLSEMRAGTRLDRAYVVLTILSTIVAAIGLLNDNVAVLIGAMVIAPLLGPNLAFIFATAIGDRTLMAQSAKTMAAGLLLAVFFSMILGAIWPDGFDSVEVLNRTVVGYEDVALALAAGAAAVLSLTTGVSSTLVGVMVAVALLPPAVTMGMLAGAGLMEQSLAAGLLLAVNIVCVNIAGQIVLIMKKLGPRTLTERADSRRLILRNVAVWLILLLALLAWIYGLKFPF
jgi:uncharacterized hydrophobic protein (TIGR00341 family)